MTLKLKRTYKYSSEYYRANFSDGTGFLYTKAQLNRFNLIINYVKKIDRMGIKPSSMPMWSKKSPAGVYEKVKTKTSGWRK